MAVNADSVLSGASPCAVPGVRGSGWTLGAWCELRGDFRTFRPDRTAALEVLDERFAPVAGQTLADYLRAVQD
jgi:predicted DNA-binding transcriptional regulator YafY